MADKANTKVRVLRAHEEHLPNHVITLTPAEVKSAIDAGWADDDADAVAYAEANEPQPGASPAPASEAE